MCLRVKSGLVFFVVFMSVKVCVLKWVLLVVFDVVERKKKVTFM